MTLTYRPLVHPLLLRERRKERAKNLLVGTLFVAALGAAAHTVSQIAPASAQEVGGWNESLSGSSARAMNPDTHAQRDSQVRASGYQRWGERLNQMLMDPRVRERHRVLDEIEFQMRQIDRRSRELDSRSGGGTGAMTGHTGNFGADGSNNK